MVMPKASVKMKKYSLIAFFTLLALYAIFQARFLIIGPSISVERPVNNSLVDAGVINITGIAGNATFLSIDDRQVYTDTAGHFEEKLIAHMGTNIIKLVARDRFGRETTKLVRVVAN